MAGNINNTNSPPPPPSPHSPSLSSLQAAASINAGIRNSSDRSSPRFERRRSSFMMNIQHNDPSIPAAGEMQHGTGNSGLFARSNSQLPENPQHHRAPSLGEIHQQLESEQEAQVNRLLQMIRSQRDEIDAMQSGHPSSPPAVQSYAPPPPLPDNSSTMDTSSRSRTSSMGRPLTTTQQQTTPRSPLQRPGSLSRQSSSRVSLPGGVRSSSQSPMLRPHTSNYDPHREDWLLGGARDESAFYQAETSMLTRENQMLKQRIRELERQISELNASSSGQHNPAANSPGMVSPLASPPVIPDAQANL